MEVNESDIRLGIKMWEFVVGIAGTLSLGGWVVSKFHSRVTSLEKKEFERGKKGGVMTFDEHDSEQEKCRTGVDAQHSIATNQLNAMCVKLDRLGKQRDADHELLIRVDQKMSDIHENCVISVSQVKDQRLTP